MKKASKKRCCRRSELEKAQHDTAVKIRKMTDEQICDFLNEIENRQPEGNSVGEFLDRIENSGMGARTMKKLKEFAAERGYVEEVS